ncbi:MAG: isoprenylcysteine carboxylmethyltransferase family protein [Candidatus Poribacteria bacterium]|nr:isoprenylcysteine carboxylmethyltransferase family protein [Candidatus Poribacteria bacterium]
MLAQKIGNFFFKIRSFTPIPYIIVLLYFANPTWISISISILFITIGESLRIWSVGYAGGMTRATALGAARDLVTTGPYSYVRNPLYLGNLLLSIGVTLFTNVHWLIPILIVGYIIQYLPIITVEEVYLLESCGTVYQTYQEQVPRFLPHFHPYPNPSYHDFSWSRAIKSEKRTLTAIIFVIGLILIRTAYNA